LNRKTFGGQLKILKNKQMNIVIVGAGGFVGQYLSHFFRNHRFQVTEFHQKDLEKSDRAIAMKIEGCHAIINLAGSTLVNKWTPTTKKEIYDSRILTTRKLIRCLSLLDNPPGFFFNASAIGIYDSSHKHNEESHHFSHDFLSNIVRDWEVAAFDAEELDIRVFCMRFGIVLGPDGGALKTLLPMFKKGLGASIGTGNQAFSFIHIDDVAEAIHFLLVKNRSGGIYNFTAPKASTNAEFSKTLGDLLNRPVLLKIPKFALKFKFGEGYRLFAQGQNVYPKRLLEQGYQFKYPDIRSVLDHVINS